LIHSKFGNASTTAAKSAATKRRTRVKSKRGANVKTKATQSRLPPKAPQFKSNHRKETSPRRERPPTQDCQGQLLDSNPTTSPPASAALCTTLPENLSGEATEDVEDGIPDNYMTHLFKEIEEFKRREEQEEALRAFASMEIPAELSEDEKKMDRGDRG